MPWPIALVDCNNFHGSCERVFQPDLRSKPHVPLLTNDGCVIARSNEANALGIAMGEPWNICRAGVNTQGVIVRSSSYTLYGDMSARVIRALSGFTPELEVYSIDEAFPGLGGFNTRLEADARELRPTVLQWSGIPVSAGIAPTKTLAKVANRKAKKDPASRAPPRRPRHHQPVDAEADRRPPRPRTIQRRAGAHRHRTARQRHEPLGRRRQRRSIPRGAMAAEIYALMSD